MTCRKLKDIRRIVQAKNTQKFSSVAGRASASGWRGLTSIHGFRPSGVALFTIQSGLRAEIVRKILEGGRVIVSEAARRGARGFVKRVNIKTIRLNPDSRKALVENLIGEAGLVAGLIRANIVRTGCTGGCNAVCFTCMELIWSENGAIHAPACRQERTRVANWLCSSPVASTPTPEG